jgi:hypothetical protein
MHIEVVPAASVPAKLLETKGSRREDWNTLTDKLMDSKRGDWVRIPLTELPERCSKLGSATSAMRCGSGSSR